MKAKIDCHQSLRIEVFGEEEVMFPSPQPFWISDFQIMRMSKAV